MEMTQHAGGEASASGESLTAKYLTFVLQEEVYAIEIVKVQEIIKIMHITKVPRMPAYVRGVINLRGRIIPTIELRRVFGLPKVEESSRNCIIVMEIQGDQGRVSLGVIVDEVADVVDIQEREIDRSAKLEGGAGNECLVGFAVIDESVRILLDVDKILSVAELDEIDTSGLEEEVAAAPPEDAETEAAAEAVEAGQAAEAEETGEPKPKAKAKGKGRKKPSKSNA